MRYGKHDRGARRPGIRPLVRAISALAALGIFLAACGSDEAEEPNEATDPAIEGEDDEQASDTAEPVELEIWVHVATHGRWFEAMAESYREEVNPEFEVNVQEVGTADDVADRLLVSLRAGGEGAPDIVDIEQSWFGQFLLGEETGLVDLRERLPEGALDDFVESRLALYSEPGHTYCLEHALTPVGLYYRADLWEDAGVDPESFETWDDFVDGARELATDDIKAISFFRDHHQTLLRQRGSDYFNAEGEPILDSDLSVETLEWMIELEDEGLAAPAPDVNNVFAPEWWAAFNADEIASVIGADWYGGVMKDNLPELAGDWRMIPLPAFEPGGARTSVWGGTGACVVESGDHVDASLDFLEFAFLSVEGNVKRYELVNLFPPFLPAFEDERLLQPDDYFGGQVLGEIFASVADEVPEQHQSPWRSEMIDRIASVADPVWRGERDVATAFSEINDAIRAQMDN